jgi:hypothetical protein
MRGSRANHGKIKWDAEKNRDERFSRYCGVE